MAAKLKQELEFIVGDVFVPTSGKTSGMLTDLHYAVQTCDIGANISPGQTLSDKKRYVDADKTEIIKKCVTSLFESIEYCIEKIPYSQHTVALIDDHSTAEVLEFFDRCVKRFANDNISIEIHNLETRGLMNSNRYCYEWMDRNGQGLVYQVQDDMLYMPHCIFEMIDLWNQVRVETENSVNCILEPWNDTWHWRHVYRYKAIPKMVIQGKFQCWLQTWDIAGGFFTSAEEFRKHWDKYERYLRMPAYASALEPKSLNKILVEDRTLAFRPFNSMAFHLQDPVRDIEPYFDWRKTWDAVENI